MMNSCTMTEACIDHSADDHPNALLQVRGLHTWIASETGIVRAVDDVSFDVRAGECIVLLGESGSGKSMTALSLLRLLPESADIVSGSIHLGNIDCLQLPESDFSAIRGRRISMIFQEPALALDPVMEIGDQIDEVLKRHTALSKTERLDKIESLLTQVGIRDANTRRRAFPFMLSGGMKQRVMIAMALAASPDILIADEPTTALDVTVQAQVLQLLNTLKQTTNMAIVLITHDLGVAAAMADRVGVMYGGELVELTDKQTFFNSPGHPYTRTLFSAVPGRLLRGRQLPVQEGMAADIRGEKHGCCFKNRCCFAMPVCSTQLPQWVRQSEGRLVRCMRFSEIKAESTDDAPNQTPAELSSIIPIEENSSPVCLTISGLKVHFPIKKGIFKRTVGYVRAVNGVDMSMQAGKTLAVVGESGCGKTTLGKSILRLIEPTAGRIQLNGCDVQRLSGDALRAFRRQVQIVFQDPFASLNPRMRIRDILIEGMLSLKIPFSEQQLIDLLTQVGLNAEALDRYPHEFSGGQRQRISIARAISVNPDFIVCDEPTSALDMSVQAQILNLLKKLQQERGLGYLFVTHNWSVVEYLADDIAVMYAGQIVEMGSAERLLTHPMHPYTRQLTQAVLRVDISAEQILKRDSEVIHDWTIPETGCPYAPRCPRVQSVCRQASPELLKIADNHQVRCWLCESSE